MSGPKKTSWLYWLLFSLVGVLAGCGLFFMVGGRGDTFADGTYIGEVLVGGLTPASAQQALVQYTKKTEMIILVSGPDGYSKKLDIAAVGGQPDPTASVDNALAKGTQGGWRSWFRWGKDHENRYPLLLNYKDKDVKRWLEQTRFDVDRKPTEPRVVWEGDAMRVAEPESGRKLDSDTVLAALPKSYQPGEYKLVLKMNEVSAQVNASELTGLVELASASTDFNAGNVNRTINLNKAAAALNGTVVTPDGVFSFNDTVGPRDLANGYLEAMVIIKNEFTPGVGGGICQVSSTLYNAVLLAGFPVVERRNHSVAVSYTPVGLDATVAYPYQDFKFRNNADSAVYINAYTRGSRLHVKLFGRRNNPISVKIERFVDETTPFTTVQKVDPALAPGAEKVDHQGVDGYKVRTYRVIYDAQGQVRERKLLATDKYTPLNKLVLVSASAPAPPNTGSGNGVKDNTSGNSTGGSITQPPAPGGGGIPVPGTEGTESPQEPAIPTVGPSDPSEKAELPEQN
ncbi:MAG: VanW family protein [Methylocystaceae bacterium]